MKSLGVAVFFMTTLFSNSYSAWFEVQADQFPRIEMLSNKQIILYRPINATGISLSSFSPTGSAGESGTIDQITIIAPSGLENTFLSLLLTAASTGKKFIIEGHISTGTTVIGSSRVQIE
jgi:hypothetical protein